RLHLLAVGQREGRRLRFPCWLDRPDRTEVAFAGKHERAGRLDVGQAEEVWFDRCVVGRIATGHADFAGRDDVGTFRPGGVVVAGQGDEVLPEGHRAAWVGPQVTHQRHAETEFTGHL